MDFNSIYEKVVSKLDYKELFEMMDTLLLEHRESPREKKKRKSLISDKEYRSFYKVKTASVLREFIRLRVIGLENIYLELSSLVAEERLGERDLNKKIKTQIESAVVEIQLGDFEMSIMNSLYIMNNSSAEFVFPANLSDTLMKKVISFGKSHEKKKHKDYYAEVFFRLTLLEERGGGFDELIPAVCRDIEYTDSKNFKNEFENDRFDLEGNFEKERSDLYGKYETIGTDLYYNFNKNYNRDIKRGGTWFKDGFAMAKKKDI